MQVQIYPSTIASMKGRAELFLSEYPEATQQSIRKATYELLSSCRASNPAVADVFSDIDFFWLLCEQSADLRKALGDWFHVCLAVLMVDFEAAEGIRLDGLVTSMMTLHAHQYEKIGNDVQLLTGLHRQTMDDSLYGLMAFDELWNSDEVQAPLKKAKQHTAQVLAIQPKGAEANKNRKDLVHTRVKQMNDGLLKSAETCRWTLQKRADYIAEKLKNTTDTLNGKTVKLTMANGKPYKASGIVKIIQGA